jgi:hypothetical protein
VNGRHLAHPSRLWLLLVYLNGEPASLRDTNAPKSILYVVTAATEAQDSSRRRSPASTTVAFDRPNVCRAASDGENTPIAAPTRRHLSPTSAQTTKQGWVHEKRSSTEKPFLLGQRPAKFLWMMSFQLPMMPEDTGEPKALPACTSRFEVSKARAGVSVQGTNEYQRSHDDRESDPTRPQLRIRPDFWLPA